MFTRFTLVTNKHQAIKQRQLTRVDLLKSRPEPFVLTDINTGVGQEQAGPTVLYEALFLLKGT